MKLLTTQCILVDHHHEADEVYRASNKQIGQRDGVPVPHNTAIAVATVEEDGVIEDALSQEEVNEVVVPLSVGGYVTGTGPQAPYGGICSIKPALHLG